MPDFIQSIRPADIADMSIVSVCVYIVLRWLQATSSRRLVISTGILIFVYAVAVQFDLHLTTLLFHFGLTIAVVVYVVVFQDDIRRAVERLLLASRWRGRKSGITAEPPTETLLNTLFDLASNRRGALIVLPGEEPVDMHLTGGTELLGRVSQPLLESLFDPHSAGHDGAVIIQDGFVTRFGVHLPLSENREKSVGLGTRHRSGLGLSEYSDALVMIVSEERGQVSFARLGELHRDVSRDELSKALNGHLSKMAEETQSRFCSRLISHRRTKLLSVLIAFVAWISIVSDRDLVQRVFLVPIEYRNVPKGIELSGSILTEARVTFSGTDRAFQFVAPGALKVSVDLSEAAAGKNEFTLTESSVRHPATLTVYRIEPRSIQLHD
ncbi:MAG: DNA integrity scanning protein DisA nucleotide-binding domain protein [Rhodopirellula sp.]|nr:DNA integrity scanning protein DisA nucleotide-binding domain protein [Rhodopirellula sp.]